MDKLNKVFVSLCLVFVGFLAVNASALAETITVVDQETAQRTLDSVPTLITAAIMAILYRFAGPLVAILKIARLDQLLEKTIKAEWDKLVDQHQLGTKPLTVEIKNEFIANAVRAAVQWGPKWLVRWAGGEEGIRQKIRARLPDFLKEVASVKV